MVDSNTIDISTNCFQYEDGDLFNGGGRGVNFNSSNVQNIPSISYCERFRGKFLNKYPKNAFGIMLFTKLQSSLNFHKRTNYFIDKNIVFDPSVNYQSGLQEVEYIGDFNYQTSVNEQVAALSFSRKISKGLAIGFSPMIAYRSQKFNSSFVSRVILDPNSNFGKSQVFSLGYNDVSSINFSNLRSYTKLGLQLILKKIKLGCTFTSPSINIAGSSSISRDITYNGATSTPETSIPSININNNGALGYMYNLNESQKKIKTIFKSPLSIAFGLEYIIKNTTVLFSTEYFALIPTYDLATPESASFYRSGLIGLGPSTKTVTEANSSKYLRITQGNNSVLNFAFAIEQKLSQRWKILASYRTDFTSYKKVSNNFWQYYYGDGDVSYPVAQKLNSTNININHFTLGISYRKSNSDIHVGILHSYGYSSNIDPLNNIAEPTDNVINNNLGSNANYALPASYSYNSFSLLIGYTHYLK